MKTVAKLNDERDDVWDERRASGPSIHPSSIVNDCIIGEDATIHEYSVLQDCEIGAETEVWRFNNLYGCTIGEECMIGSVVEIQSDVEVGDRSRIQSHAFLCSLVTVGDGVFVSHGVKFINDLYPPSGDSAEWEETIVHDGASVGTNATILPVEIGENATIGAGAVVTEDVPENAIVAGNPAEVVRFHD